MLWNSILMKNSQSVFYKWKEIKLNITLIESANLSSSQWNESRCQKQKTRPKCKEPYQLAK